MDAAPAPELVPEHLGSVAAFVRQLRDSNVKRFVRLPDGHIEVEYFQSPSQPARKPASDSDFG